MQREILFHILLKLSNSCGNRLSGHYGVSDTASDRKLSLTPKLNGSNMEVQLGFLPGNTELIWEVGRNDDLGQFNQIYRRENGVETLGADIEAMIDPTDSSKLIVTDQDPSARLL